MVKTLPNFKLTTFNFCQIGKISPNLDTLDLAMLLSVPFQFTVFPFSVFCWLGHLKMSTPHPINRGRGSILLVYFLFFTL